MIEINLIPDVKQEMIQAQKLRNTAISISIIVAIAAGGVVVLLGLLVGAQTVRESSLRSDIKKQFATLKNTENIDNALTIQHQLAKIAELNKNKTIDSRLLDVIGAIKPAAPNDVKYSTVRLDPTTRTLTIEGMAENGFAATETFRKLILNIKVESVIDGTTTSVPLTDAVAISETSYGEGSDGTRVLRFTMSFVYPEGLFDNTLMSVRIVTPTSKVDVTDSKTRVPDSLFGAKAKDMQTEGN